MNRDFMYYLRRARLRCKAEKYLDAHDFIVLARYAIAEEFASQKITASSHKRILRLVDAFTQDLKRRLS